MSTQSWCGGSESSKNKCGESPRKEVPLKRSHKTAVMCFRRGAQQPCTTNSEAWRGKSTLYSPDNCCPDPRAQQWIRSELNPGYGKPCPKADFLQSYRSLSLRLLSRTGPFQGSGRARGTLVKCYMVICFP